MKPFLAWRGIHFLVTRYGSEYWRGRAFDAKFRCGIWGDEQPALAQVVRQHLNAGNLLMLGCGRALLIQSIGDFENVVGVDISDVGLKLASEQQNDRVRFFKHNMDSFESDLKFDVILFSESIYYSTSPTALITRLIHNLKPFGVVIISIAEPERFKSIVEQLDARFERETVTPNIFVLSLRNRDAASDGSA